MINGKITASGIGKTHQPCLRFIAERTAPITDNGAFNGVVRYFSNTGLPVYTAGQREWWSSGYSGSFCGVYSQITTQPDQPDKEIRGFQRVVDQQSGPCCAGRILSKEGLWQKGRNKLKCHTPMTVCGSKNSLRFIIFLSLLATCLFPLNLPLLN
jgi:hypothetical protein